jgi:Xaa-Pro aminopeptidase
MITSNEPGYYEDGAFGIRIENLCITIPSVTPNSFNAPQYCQFETITLCPIQLSLINFTLMTPSEINWLNNYHRSVREKLEPLMKEIFPEAIEYLYQQTQEWQG